MTETINQPFAVDMEKTISQRKRAKKVLQESALLNISNFIFIAFKFLSGFMVARFLGPSLYGLRNIFGLVIEYEYFTHLGTYDAMRREAPFHRGKGDRNKAVLIENSAFGINFVYSLIVFVSMLGLASYLHKLNCEQIYIDFTIFFGLYSVSEKLHSFYLIKLTIDKRIKVLSETKMLHGLIYSTTCILFTYYWGLRGLLIGLLLTDMIVNLFIIVKVREIPRFNISFSILSNLLKIGFPIMLITLVMIMLRSIDRIIIANLLTQEMLGYFAVGTILSGLVLASVSDLIRVIFVPRIMEKLGRTGDILQVKFFFVEPTIVIAYCAPFIISILFLGIRIPIQYFLPEYLPAIGVAKILIVGSFFSVISMTPVMVCVAINKQVQMIFLTLIAVLANGIFSFLFIYWQWSIKGVAIGTTLSYFLLSLLVLYYTMKQFDSGYREMMHFLRLVYSPFLYTVILLLALNRFYSISANGIWADILHSFIAILIFSLMYSPIVIFVRKQSVFQSLIHIFKKPQGNIGAESL